MATTSPVAPSLTYPIHVDASREETPSRALWLVKWALAVPHYLLLALLWAAFVLLSLVALVNIVVTGRYPRTIFDFNVGVLRWSWRVAYYSYGALATDQYPPFTLKDVPEYPAHLEVDYPEKLSRGLALVKWWLLAIPHYLVVAVLVGATLTWRDEFGIEVWRWEYGGLIGVLALIVGFMLLFTGRYPQPLYDLLLGLNRWVIRVAAYAGLMTDTYPPFRLDMGEHDDGGAVVMSSTAPPAPTSRPVPGTPPAEGGHGGGQPYLPQRSPGGGVRPGSGWTGGRIVVLLVGTVLVILGLGGVAGAAGLGIAAGLRSDGYITSPEAHLTADGHAAVLSEMAVHVPAAWPDGLLGDIRVRAMSTDGSDIFVGVTTMAEARELLDGVDHTVWNDNLRSTRNPGGALTIRPEDADIWRARASGGGTQTVDFALAQGTWVAVVTNADGSAGVDATVDVGADVPWLGDLGVASLVVGLVLLGAGVVIMVVAARAAARS